MAQFPDEQGEDGSFERQPDEFRDWVETPEAGRYHLYVCKACPWAHRAWLTRNLMGLDEAVSVSFVDPIRDDETGWAFREGDGHGPDEVEGFEYLSEAYHKTDPNFKGRITVPVLWDKQEKRIVETDYRLFCTLVRFGAVYFSHFKCNRKQIRDYAALQVYLERIYDSPGVKQTVNFDHIKRHYYYTHDEINPSRIVPLGPEFDWI